MKRLAWPAALLAVVLSLAQSAPVFADNGEMLAMMESLKKQMAQMQSTIDAQNLRLQQLESRQVLETPQDQIPLAAPAKMSGQDFQKSLKDNIGEVVPFLKGATYAGDFRLRHEYFDYFDKDTTAGATDRSRSRFRIRLRYGFEKDFGDDWKTGFRLVTASPSTSSGVATDNGSTNTTLGNPGYFTFKNIYVDRAYAAYSPDGLKDYGAIKEVTVGAGKFENPFYRYSTPIMWDADITPEGAYEKMTLQLHSSEENKLNLYGTAGQFLVNENAGADTDTQLYGYQGALHWSTVNFGTDVPVQLSTALSFYHTHNYSRTVASNTTGASFLRTNSQNGDEFEIWDIYPELQFNVGGKPVTLWYNFVTNADDTDGDESVLGEQEDAWGAGFKFGKAKKKGQWEIFYGYYKIDINAVMAAFNDSDFGGPGGVGHTNRKGHKLGVGYMLTDNMMFNWTGMIVEPVTPTSALANAADESVFRSQADLSYKF